MVAMLEQNPRRGIELRLAGVVLIAAGLAWSTWSGDSRGVGAWAFAAAGYAICLHLFGNCGHAAA